MGVYSWITSDSHKPIAIDEIGKAIAGTPDYVYLLNPFGEPYIEHDYSGYGLFQGKDIYELIAQWNRPEWCSNTTLNERREIGISLSCYDKDHVLLKYPIKIVEHICNYEEAEISPSDPYQGCYSLEDTPTEIMQEIQNAFKHLHDAVENKNSDNYVNPKYIAMHPNTKKDVLIELSKKRDYKTCMYLLSNPVLPQIAINNILIYCRDFNLIGLKLKITTRQRCIQQNNKLER